MSRTIVVYLFIAEGLRYLVQVEGRGGQAFAIAVAVNRSVYVADAHPVTPWRQIATLSGRMSSGCRAPQE